jgi:hypothetical protein
MHDVSFSSSVKALELKIKQNGTGYSEKSDSITETKNKSKITRLKMLTRCTECKEKRHWA